MIQDISEEKKKLDDLTEEERRSEAEKKARLKEIFRDDEDENNLYVPLIIKASQAGALETLLTETSNIVGQHFQVSIIETGVGPITEADISLASSTGATILGFDCSCSQMMTQRAEAANVPVKLHKLIYKFTDDLEDIIHDVRLKEKEVRGEDCSREIVGSATVQETFTVTNKKNKSKETIFGSKIVSGELSSSLKYQITRDEEVIADGLTLASLKHHKKSVSSLDKGHECGICFSAKRSSFECEAGDVIECYREVKNDEPRFSFKAGVVKSF